MLVPGSVVEDYQVEAVVGRGAMATVYRVYHLERQTSHALKVLHAGDASLFDRFAREVQAQRRLVHPNVVRVEGMIDAEGLPGLLMELVPGAPLSVLLADRPFDLRSTREVFSQLCNGVEAAHALRIVHRDLKPGNVLVAATERGLVAKISDFGMVKVLGDSFSGPALTRSQSGLGTPGYMSPEQVFDAKRADERTDIFALGCLLYRMVCGVAPFSGELRDLLQNAVRGIYPDPRSLRPGLPDPIVATIHACLQPDRDRRPPDIAALRQLYAGEAARG